MQELNGKISWVKKQVAIHQLTIQKNAIYESIVHIDRESSPFVENAVRYKARQLLVEYFRQIESQIDELQAVKSKPKRLWSGMIFKTYLWAVKDRFKID